MKCDAKENRIDADQPDDGERAAGGMNEANQPDRPQIRTTNGLERLNEEIKRRTRVVPGALGQIPEPRSMFALGDGVVC